MRNGLDLPFDVSEPNGMVGNIIDGVGIMYYDPNLFLEQMNLYYLRYDGLWYTAEEVAKRFKITEDDVMKFLWEDNIFPHATYWDGQWWFSELDLVKIKTSYIKKNRKNK